MASKKMLSMMRGHAQLLILAGRGGVRDFLIQTRPSEPSRCGAKAVSGQAVWTSFATTRQVIGSKPALGVGSGRGPISRYLDGLSDMGSRVLSSCVDPVALASGREPVIGSSSGEGDLSLGAMMMEVRVALVCSSYFPNALPSIVLILPQARQLKPRRERSSSGDACRRDARWSKSRNSRTADEAETFRNSAKDSTLTARSIPPNDAITLGKSDQGFAWRRSGHSTRTLRI